MNNNSLTLALPSIPHRVASSDNHDAFVDVEVGDLVIEIAMGRALVLAGSGLYLWWPRRSQKGKTLLVPRLRKTGRLKWRDVYAASRIIALTMMIIFTATGMPGSPYWGKAWSVVGHAVTPTTEVDAGQGR